MSLAVRVMLLLEEKPFSMDMPVFAQYTTMPRWEEGLSK